MNEAITELLAVRITRTYLRQQPQTGITQEHIDFFLDEANIGYPREIWIIKQYIALISAVSNLSETIVQNMLIREYLNNGTPMPETFAMLLHEHLPSLPGENWEWITSALHTQLSANEFTPDSAFYEIYADIMTLLPEATQEHLRERLTQLNIQFLGPLSEAEEK